MADEHRAWARQGEAFWRAHHEAWKRSDLNQRQYCDAEGIHSRLSAIGVQFAVGTANQHIGHLEK
jgi:hypothetical protein